MEPLNLQHLLTRFSDHWSQRTIGTLNDYEIKLAKLLGEFVWHSHPDTDELFLVVYGTLNIQLRDRDVILKPGEVFVVPRGVEHVSDFFFLFRRLISCCIALYELEEALRGVRLLFCILGRERIMLIKGVCSVRKRTKRLGSCCWNQRGW